MKIISDYFENLIPDNNFSTFTSTRNITLEKLLEKINPMDFPIIQMNQIHSNNVSIINEHKEKIIPKTDAIITTKKNIFLTIRSADCLPIIITHPYPLVAAIHAGRIGTQQEIILKTLEKIHQEYEIKDSFNFWFGPAICKDCYEIDNEHKLHFDLIEENKKQIKNIISNPRIYESNLCTSCHNHQFFSYRKGDQENRLYTLVKIN